MGCQALPLKSELTVRDTMTMLPVDRTLNIYGALANRLEARGARKGLSELLARRYLEGEKDEHRLMVEGLSYLQAFHREIDSRE